ncbi:zinc-alpha-2-glycoprotein-like [Pygocentrus nattereri]|uniref:zinc-alpha-2-glycoprotein-like n=1 Tax=Pygocentrus nattereri TaxID=42514 RepID=UPI0008143A87|nr:zinc-alpha-2-glycoprotein-like [Pygocentrus nattereri]XP_017539815.1 zinc-alpha-2-glycoprotein-like [Pygocentrus nattereri]
MTSSNTNTASATALLALALLLLVAVAVVVVGDKHSLFYLYTIQSRNSTDRVYEFSTVTLLDDRQIDSYSSTDGVRTPKQDWLKEVKEREWTAGTDKLKYDGHQLNKILDIQMKTFRHDESDGHTLQWRIGCEGEKHSDGSVSVLNCINEYGYDGQSLISYNWTSRKWSAPVGQDGVTEEWNAGRGQNAVQRCEECEHWLKIYLQYNTTETKQSEVDVYVFVKKSVTDLKKLTLTCLATGFYPKDMEIKVRKVTTSLPEHLLRSSGVRPNDDGTYQLRKSVEINEGEAADYDCYVTHSSISTPVIKQWDGKCSNCQSRLIRRVIVGLIVGVTIGMVLLQVGFMLVKHEN